MKKYLLFYLVVFGVFIGLENANATTYNWTGTAGNSNWNDKNNWGGTNYPQSGDVAQVGVVAFSGVQPTINTTGLSCTTLTIGSASAVTLTISNAFTVTGVTTVGSGSTIITGAVFSTKSLSITGSTFTLGAALNITGTSGTTLTFASGTTTFNTSSFLTTLSSGGSMQVSAGIVALGSPVTVTSGSLTMSAGSLTANAALTLSNGVLNMSASTTLTANAAVGITGAVNINGSCSITGASTITGTSLNITGSYTLTDGTALTINGAGSITGGSTSVITFNNTGGITVPTIAITGGIGIGVYSGTSLSFQATNPGIANISGTIFLSQGGSSFLIGSNVTMNLTSGSFTEKDPITFNNAGTLTTTSFPINFNSNSGGGNTYINSGSITANSTMDFWNGTFTSTSTSTITSNANFTIDQGCSFANNGGTVYIQNGATFSMAANSKNFSNSGIINVLAASVFNDLAPSVSITNTGTINVTPSATAISTFVISGSGVTFNNTSPGIINLIGLPTVSSNLFTYSANSSTITNSGAINATNANLLWSANAFNSISNSGGITLVTSSITVTSATTFTNTGSISASSSSTITLGKSSQAVAFNNNSPATFTLSASTLNYASSATFANSGTVTASSSSSILLGYANSTGTVISNTGIFNAGISNSPCTITGASTTSQFAINNAQTFNLGSTSNITLNNTRASNPCTVSNSSTGVFTLESDQWGSASIGISGATGTNTSTINQFIGIYNVQRYINGGSSSGLYNNGRGYRILSSPVNISNSTTGTGNIGLGYLNTAQSVVNQNAVPGTVTNSGTLTAGPSGGGFDITGCCGNPTIYLYDEAIPSNTTGLFTGGKTPGVTAITSTGVSVQFSSNTPVSETIPVGNAFYLYYIGDDGSSKSYSGSRIADADTITATGYINQQSVPVKLWFSSNSYLSDASTGTSAGFNMVGNPYPSAIDLYKLYTDNGSTFHLFSALSDYNDQFATFDASMYPSTLAYSSPSYFTHFIASGQGFMVQATGTTQTLTFMEDQKVTNATAALNTTSTPPILLAHLPSHAGTSTNATQVPVSGASRSILTSPSIISGMHIKFQHDSVNNDEISIAFNSKWSDNFDSNDAPDLDGSSGVYLSSYTSDNVRTCINALGDYTAGKRVKLYVRAGTTGLYSLSMEDFQNIDTSAFNIYLVDNLKKDSLDMARYKKYNFNLTASDTASYDNRFVLAIEKKQLPPYQLVSFAGQKVTKGVQLNWKVNNEGDYTGFVLQKQDAGGNFNQLYSEQSNDSQNYSYTDVSPVTGNNIYRLQQNDINGNITYSNTVTIVYNPATGAETFSVYPNPAKDLISISINSTSSVATNYNSNIYNAAGTLVAKRSVSSNTWTEDVSSYKAGVYIIELSDNEGNLIGKSKFVKTN